VRSPTGSPAAEEGPGRGGLDRLIKRLRAGEASATMSAMSRLDAFAEGLTWDQRISQLTDFDVDGRLIAENLEDARCDRRPPTP
jgi:hypothetical protein